MHEENLEALGEAAVGQKEKENEWYEGTNKGNEEYNTTGVLARHGMRGARWEEGN